jgi:DNA-binding NtrC family response regulator
MVKRALLTQPDRQFFQLVSRAALSNPFGDERRELDRQIAGLVGEGSREEILTGAMERVKERVARLEAKGHAHLRMYAGDDLLLMQSVFLFEVFYRFLDQFDQVILNQVKAGDKPCMVPFAREAMALLAERGFSGEERRRFFAFFYQLRRAFYFIDRGLIGRSRAMQELQRHLWNSVFTHNMGRYVRYLWNRMEDFSTILLGETGTGKGTAAAAIGRSGFIPFEEEKGRFAESFTRNFIAINLSQYPESLIESELFGHKKGAFTGAIERHEGVFSRCTPCGSIFLDEVGDVSIPVQIKLLQVLQERTFSMVGSHEKLSFRGRVIAATNRPLDELRQKGRLRDDFYYRLSSDVVVIPSLRQRLNEDSDELDLMVTYLLRRMIGEEVPEIAVSVREAIRRDLGDGYDWPGNVRELEQAVRRILLTRTYQGDMAAVTSDLRGTIFTGIDSGSMDAQQLLRAYCALLYERHGTYEEVARRTNLDRRTVKKYVLAI